MKKVLCFLLGALIVASLVYAQEWKGQGRLPGIVYDEQGKPMEGVKVKLFCPKFNGGFEVMTDKDGKWTGAWMRTGAWNLDFEKIGYMPVRKSFQMNQFVRNKELEVTMKKVEGLVVTEEMKKDLNAANDLYDKKEYDRAIAAYKAFLVEFPEAYYIWRNIGNAYFVQEKYDLAEAAYKEILAKKADDAEAVISIGNCYANRASVLRGDSREELEKHDFAQNKALEWYAKVPIEKINDSASLYSIGLTFRAAQKPDDALNYFRKAVEIEPTSADALYELGLAYTALQNKEEAIVVFENYLKVDADSERAGQVKGFLDYLRKK